MDADEPGKHRDKLLGRVRGVVEFNRQHPKGGSMPFIWMWNLTSVPKIKDRVIFDSFPIW